eukprot:scaffold172584_cov19-Prasinocladus_malaysianus.AAC.1
MTVYHYIFLLGNGEIDLLIGYNIYLADSQRRPVEDGLLVGRGHRAVEGQQPHGATARAQKGVGLELVVELADVVPSGHEDQHGALSLVPGRLVNKSSTRTGLKR